MGQIKVLHYIRHLGLGGTEKTCQLFFQNASQDIDAHVVFEKSGEHPRLQEFMKGDPSRLHEVDSYHDTKNQDPIELQSLINHIKPDILHVYRSGYNEYPENGPDIDVPHCVETNVFGFYDSNPKIDRHLFMSKWLMNYSAKQLGYKPTSYDFVNNPVEMPYTDEQLEIAKKWHAQGAIIVGRSGRPDNGIYNAVNVNAVRLLRMQGYDIRFLVLAPPSNMINDLVEFQIPFDFIEPTTNPLVISTFYNSIDILAHARADGESFGINIAEAMIHGKPVITHVAVPSVPGMGVFQAQTELVDHGSTGFVVQNDPGEYSEALKGLIDNQDLRVMFGMNSHNKAIQQYEVGQCVKKLENIYREIV